jgi:hypothetical protein
MVSLESPPMVILCVLLFKFFNIQIFLTEGNEGNEGASRIAFAFTFGSFAEELKRLSAMKKLIIFLIILLGSIQVAPCEKNISYEPSDWPHHTIKFPSEGTLKDIFDAGIRPYRFPSLERTALGFKHINVSFEMKTGELLPKVPVEWADLDILKEGLISSIEMTSPNLSPQQAELAMIPYLKYGKRTTEQLRAFLSAAGDDTRGYDDPYNGDSSRFRII